MSDRELVKGCLMCEHSLTSYLAAHPEHKKFEAALRAYMVTRPLSPPRTIVNVESSQVMRGPLCAYCEGQIVEKTIQLCTSEVTETNMSTASPEKKAKVAELLGNKPHTLGCAKCEAALDFTVSHHPEDSREETIKDLMAAGVQFATPMSPLPRYITMKGALKSDEPEPICEGCIALGHTLGFEYVRVEP